MNNFNKYLQGIGEQEERETKEIEVIKNKKLEDLLKRLYSEESKASAIKLAIEKGELVTPYQIKETIETFQKKHKWITAIEISEKAGQCSEDLIDETEALIEKNSSYKTQSLKDLANCTKKFRYTEKAKQIYKKIIAIHEKQKYFSEAHRIAKEQNYIEDEERLYLLGIKHYEKKESSYDAIKLAECRGEKEKLKELFKKSIEYYKKTKFEEPPFWNFYNIAFGIAEIALKNGEEELSKELTNVLLEHEMISNGKRSYNYIDFLCCIAKFFKQKGENNKANELYEKLIDKEIKGKRFEQAIHWARVWGNREKIIEIYEKQGLKKEAAREKFIQALEKKAENTKQIYEELIKVYSEGKDYFGASRIAEEMDDYENAIKYSELEGNFLGAIETAQKFYPDKVAELQKKGYDHYLRKKWLSFAAYIAQDMKDYQKAIELFIKGKDLEKAANLAKKIGDIKTANQIYEELIKKNLKYSDYSSATQYSLQKGELERAKIFGEKAIEQEEENEYFQEASETAKKIGDNERAEAYEEAAKWFQRIDFP